MPGEFQGRRALVTGATRGIGAAVYIERLREEGAMRTGHGAAIGSVMPKRKRSFPADITTADGCARVVNAVREQFGGIDIIAHVLGGSSAPAGGFAVLDDAQWWRELDLNLFPSVRLGSRIASNDAGARIRRHRSCHLDPA